MRCAGNRAEVAVWLTACCRPPAYPPTLLLFLVLIAGNLVSILSSLVICLVWGYLRPQNYGEHEKHCVRCKVPDPM